MKIGSRSRESEESWLICDNVSPRSLILNNKEKEINHDPSQYQGIFMKNKTIIVKYRQK